MPNISKILSSLPTTYYARTMSKIHATDIMENEALQHFVKGMVTFSGLTEDRALHIAAMKGSINEIIQILKALKTIYDKTDTGKKSILELAKSSKTLRKIDPTNTALIKNSDMKSSSAIIVNLDDPKSVAAYKDHLAH